MFRLAAGIGVGAGKTLHFLHYSGYFSNWDHYSFDLISLQNILCPGISIALVGSS